MWNLLTMFVTLHAPFCMFLKSFEFLEFVLLDEMTCFATLNSSQAQLKSQVSKTGKQQLQDNAILLCWLVKRFIGTLESTEVDLCLFKAVA